MSEAQHPEHMRGQVEALTIATVRIEQKVAELDKWADQAAAKQDYSTANSCQKSAVDLHSAIAIMKDAIFPHYHSRPGFDYTAGDRCPGCDYDEYMKRPFNPDLLRPA